jgi:ABC-type nitrate/sulfonate/bicarbonate transport system substrate-binding protein
LFTNDPMATSILARGLGEIVDDGPPCAKRLGDPFDFGTFVLSGRLARERPGVARRLVAAIDEAIARTERDPSGAIRAMARFTPPEQRTLAGLYPPARFLPSAEVPAARLAAEIARERRYGILTEEARVQAWSSR